MLHLISGFRFQVVFGLGFLFLRPNSGLSGSISNPAIGAASDGFRHLCQKPREKPVITKSRLVGNTCPRTSWLELAYPIFGKNIRFRLQFSGDFSCLGFLG